MVKGYFSGMAPLALLVAALTFAWTAPAKGVACNNYPVKLGGACCDDALSGALPATCGSGFGYCASPTAAIPGGTCKPCGALFNLPCCPGKVSCNGGAGYCPGPTPAAPYGTCSPCGVAGSPCCAGKSTCTGGICTGKTAALPDGMCVAPVCGTIGKPCCEGKSCSKGFCSSGPSFPKGICRTCGSPGLPCCSGQTTCKFGYCKNPTAKLPDGTCFGCNYPSLDCCPGNEAACNGGNGFCLGATASSPGTCTVCGTIDGSPCCPGKTECNFPGGYCTPPTPGRPDGVCRYYCASAADCDDFNECTTDRCIRRKCHNPIVADGTSCELSGKCKSGRCITPA